MEGGGCTCGPGLVADDARGVCEDLDECASGAHACSQAPGDHISCFNLVGGYRCGCGAGWDNAEGGACADVDECEEATHACHPDATCNNTLGSYACECARGCGPPPPRHLNSQVTTRGLYTPNTQRAVYQKQMKRELYTLNIERSTRFTGDGVICQLIIYDY